MNVRKILGMDNKKINYSQASIIVMIVLVFAILSNYLLDVGFTDSIAFLLYQIFGLWIPGFGLISILNLKNATIVEKMALAYGSGYCLNIVMYYLFVPFHISQYIILGFIALNIISIIAILRKKNQNSFTIDDKIGLYTCFGFIIMIGGYLLIAFASCNLIPDNTQGNTFYQDLLHWLGNSIALAKEYPPVDFRTLIPNYHYHYFSSMQIATMNLVTGISIAKIGFYYSFMQSLILLVLSCYVFFKRILRNNKLVLISMIILLCTAGYEEISFMTYVHHIYLAPFGFDIGMALGLLVFYCVNMQNECGKLCPTYLIMTLLLFTVCAGAKAPISVVLLCGIGAICFYWIFIKKNYKLGFSYGIGLFLCFSIIYFFVLSGASETYQTMGNPLNLISAVGPLKNIYVLLIGLPIPSAIAKVTMLCIFPLISQPWIFTLFFLALIYKIFNFKKIDVIDAACFLITIAGIILAMYLKYFGLSQMYFMLATYPYALIFGVRGSAGLYYELIQKQKPIVKANRRIFVYAVAVIYILGGLIFFWTNNYNNATTYYFSKGLRNSIGLNLINIIPDENYMTHKEYEAYQWIRMNTESNSKMVCDQILEFERFSYSPGVFSERYIYKPDNYNELKKLMTNDFDNIFELQKKGIQYIIQTLDISPEFSLPGIYGKLIYENSEVRVYKLYKLK